MGINFPQHDTMYSQQLSVTVPGGVVGISRCRYEQNISFHKIRSYYVEPFCRPQKGQKKTPGSVPCWIEGTKLPFEKRKFCPRIRRLESSNPLLLRDTTKKMRTIVIHPPAFRITVYLEKKFISTCRA